MHRANGWRPLNETQLDYLPDEPGVFELGSLVRNVIFVGGAESASVRDGVRAALTSPRLRLTARAIRFEVSPDPSERERELISGYVATHAGALPPEQPGTRRTAS